MQRSDLVDRARTDECIRDGGEGDWQWRERDKRSGRATSQTQHTYSCISVVISPQQGAWRELN